MICIDQCYCEKKTFEYLITRARQDHLELSALAEREGCGTHCGWCVAYLRQALKTGRTSFDFLLPKESLIKAEQGEATESLFP